MWTTQQKQTLNRRRQLGFTIVELLIVIVVIGILAAITIVAYSGIQQKAHIAALQSDLDGAASTLGVANLDNGTYPADLSSAGLKASPGTTYQYTYTSSGDSYCLTGINSGVAYMISTANQTPTAGVCPGDTGPGGDTDNGPLNSGVVTTLAGSTVTPTSYVAVDSSGNVYVVDSSNNKIRKITSSGVASTFAGSGTAGNTDGTGTSAQFNNPAGIDVDSSGNVYVADSGNSRIRKISPSGVVTTLAGSTNGFADGTGSSAQFFFPSDVAVDSSGNVYVADSSTNRIRKVSPGGTVTTIAGSGVAGYLDGTGTSAQFSGPSGIAISSSGNIYVLDSNRIREITSNGVVTTLAGSGTAGYLDGTGTGAQFNNPSGIAVVGTGPLYVSESGNNRIRKISSSGVVTTLAGSGTVGYADGTGTAAQFSWPSDIAISSSGTLYVADSGNYEVRKIQ